MQGIFITKRHDTNNKRFPDRPSSRKQIERILAGEIDGLGPEDIVIEATSMFGNEHGGPIASMPDGEVHFVGPNPHKLRNFYGTLVIKDGVATVKKSR